MNHNDINRMARECGLTINGYVMLGVERFAALVAEAEREECARLAETQWETPGTQRRTAERCAAEIRARGNE